jgi:hypothetical protein
MHLNKLIRSLIIKDGADDLFLRAIRLYEFQVAIFFPLSFKRLTANNNDHRDQTRLIRKARIRAAVRVIEDIEARDDIETRLRPNRLRQLVKNMDYRRLYDEVIAISGGWPLMLDAETANTFDDNVQANRKNAAVVAKMVDVACRYARTPDLPKHQGIINAVNYIVRKDSIYSCDFERSAIINRWKQFKPTSLFLYLLLCKNFRLMPAKVSKKTFLPILLRQTKNVEVLRYFFRAYQHLCDVLRPTGFLNLEIATIDLECDPPPFSWLPLDPKQVADAFEGANRERM